MYYITIHTKQIILNFLQITFQSIHNAQHYNLYNMHYIAICSKHNALQSALLCKMHYITICTKCITIGTKCITIGTKCITLQSLQNSLLYNLFRTHYITICAKYIKLQCVQNAFCYNLYRIYYISVCTIHTKFITLQPYKNENALQSVQNAYIAFPTKCTTYQTVKKT